MKRIGRIAGVLFDWGRTLTRWTFSGGLEEFLHHWMQQVHHLLSQRGYKVSMENLNQVHQRLIKGYRAFREKAHIELPRHVLDRFLLRGVGVFDDRLVMETSELMTHLICKYQQLDEEALEVLRTLKNWGLRTGIISNALNSDPLQRIIKKTGLDRFVDVVVISCEVGLCKPDPAIFSYALRELGTKPQETLMVGNDLYTDIYGASSAGLPAILLTCHPVNTDHPKAGTPTHTIHQLSDLLTLIKEASPP